MRSIELASAILPLLVGLILALLILAFGPIILPVVFSVLFVPWLLQDPVRLFIFLIVTWPILTLYLRVPLPAGIPDLTYDRALILLLLGVLILQVLLLQRRLMKITPLDILVLVYVLAQLSSRVFVLWFGGMGRPNLDGLLTIVLIPVMLYWMAKNLLVSRVHLKWFLYALVIASLLICLTGLYEQAVGTQERLFTVSVSLAGEAERSTGRWLDVPGGRAAGVMGNPAIYGAVLGIGVLAAVSCLADPKRKSIQAALVATIGILLYGVFASYTRSAWLSVFIVLFVAQFLINGLWKKTLPIFVLGLLLLFLMWDVLPNRSAIVSRATSTYGTITGSTGRLSLASLGWALFLAKPLLGWGLAALDTLSQSQVGYSSHNIYLTFLVDGGLVLFLSFSAIVGYLLIKVIRVYRSTPKSNLNRNLLVAMTGSVVIFLLSGLALELRYFGYFNALFWIAVGVIDCLGRVSEGE